MSTDGDGFKVGGLMGEGDDQVPVWDSESEVADGSTEG